MKILIITEGFPKVNQSWVDTYLEQLLVNNLCVGIYSSNKSPRKYHPKVDRLNLREFVMDFDLKLSCLARYVFSQFLLNPISFYYHAKKSFSIAFDLKYKYDIDFFFSFFKTLRFAVLEDLFSDFDIIHSHCEVLAFEFIFLSIIYDIPLVYTFHGLLPKNVVNLEKKKRIALYSEVSKVFSNTNFSKQQVQTIGCPPEKIDIIPQGLPIDEYEYSPKKCPVRGEYLNLLSVGRFHRDKGHIYGLLAAARLIRSNIKINYSLVGVGPEKERLINVISRLGLSGHIYIHENLEDVLLKQLYKEAHIFIFPSIDNKHGEHVETQGVVLQEAQASGCIPIATRVGGIPECVNDMKDAILVKDRSSKALFEAVRYLLDRPEEWHSFQDNGRRNVELNFSADAIGKRMAKILKGIAADGKKK